ncbi:hypothetical protein [Streptomyces sp. BBFR109]|uniref:hypothetical protein n=1 Tax=Streptomyces sp. BBFR109 TaxID=3448172 RepID=UPI003F75D993
MIELVLTDDTGTLTLPLLEVPLTQGTIENATDVETLDKNVHTNFISQKRQWSHTWAYLSEDDYNALRAFYDRQFTLFRYPRLSIPYYSISDVVVRMKLNDKNIVTHAGEVSDVEVSFRETTQLAGGA